MAKIKLSAQGQQNLHLGLNEKIHHYQLKNLGFEESGHRGFQKELTEEQLGLIEKVKSKEDVSNRVTTISDKNTHEQYASAKAVYDAVNECGKFELIDSATLTEDVVKITPTINGQYKKIYWRFRIPTNNADSSSTEKARFYFCLTNGAITEASRLIIQGAAYIQNFTTNWQAHLYTDLIEHYARSELWYGNNNIDVGYPKVPSTSEQNGVVLPWKKLAKNYIDELTVQMASDNGGRVFPAGTTYELWGVKK